jgi:hypothetical protein
MEVLNARQHAPLGDQEGGETAGLSREVLDQMCSALRSYYETESSRDGLRAFHHQLAAIDRVEYVHDKGVEAVKKALEEADGTIPRDGSEPMGATAPLWRPSSELE